MTLLDMSVAGGAVILAVIVLRALGLHRLPNAMFTVLWAVALLRLLVPVSVSSAVSVYGLAGVRSAEADGLWEALPMTPEAEGPVFVPAAVADGAAEPAQGGQTSPAGQDGAGASWLTAAWGTGALACGGFFAVAYVRSRRRFREAVEVKDALVRRWQEGHPLRRKVRVCLSGRVDAPMTYGLFRPVILLPASLDWRDKKGLEFILAHEYGHIRRLDGLRKLILTAAVCLHWFNPLVWVMFILANRDMEMACDEYVVRRLETPARADYARTLLRMEEARSSLAPLVSHFSADAMEERIKEIMKTKRMTAWAVAVSLILTVGVTAVFATDPPAETAEPENGPVAEEPAATPVPQPIEDLKPRYVWDLSSGSGVVYEEEPDGADYLLDIRPYGYRAPVDFQYVNGGQSFNSPLQPGAGAVVGSAEGTYETLVIVHSAGRLTMGQRSLDGGEENPVGGQTLDVKDGDIITGSCGWTVEGGTEFYIHNDGDTELALDAFLYETK